MYICTHQQPASDNGLGSFNNIVSVSKKHFDAYFETWDLLSEKGGLSVYSLHMPTCSRWLAPYEIQTRTSHLRIFHQPFQVIPALPVPTVSMSLLAVPLQVSLLTSLLSFNRQCSTKTFLTLKTPPCSHSQITSFSTTFTPSPSR